MRPLVLLLALLALPACDTTTEPDPVDEPDPISVLVRYRVTVTGAANEVLVTYTDADGAPVVVGVDFARSTVFRQEVLLAPGTEGTFSVNGTGFVTNGNLIATTTTLRSDDDSQIVSETRSATASGTQELTVTAPVQVAVITERPTEAP